jgi:hypothetical protein
MFHNKLRNFANCAKIITSSHILVFKSRILFCGQGVQEGVVTNCCHELLVQGLMFGVLFMPFQDVELERLVMDCAREGHRFVNLGNFCVCHRGMEGCV